MIITEKEFLLLRLQILHFSACTKHFPRLLSYFVIIYNRKQLNEFKYVWFHISSLFYPYINTIIHNILTIDKKISILFSITALLTGQQFIELLPAIERFTDGLIFIGSMSHVILTSECQGVVQILRL